MGGPYPMLATAYRVDFVQTNTLVTRSSNEVVIEVNSIRVTQE